jgi:hypothetical protein
MGKSKSNWAIFVALAVIIFLLIYMIFFGGAALLQNILPGGTGGEQLDPPTDPGKDCTDYHIGDEYQDEFGLSVIVAARNACQGAGGVWTDGRNELSCAWPPPPGGFDCEDYAWIDGSLDFCVDELAAFFYCSPNIAYIGCYCDIPKPSSDDYPWGEGENGDVPPDGDQSPCELSYPFCDANCDSGQWCMEIVPQTLFFSQPWCDCVPLYQDSDCDDFCQSQYGYDYGNLAHSHYDCDEGEDYIDGCCCGNLDQPPAPDRECKSDQDCPDVIVEGYTISQKCYGYGDVTECRYVCWENDFGVNGKYSKGICVDSHQGGTPPGVFYDWCSTDTNVVEYSCEDSGYNWLDGSNVNWCEPHSQGCTGTLCSDGACAQ